MSFGLGHGRELDDAGGLIGVTADQLPPLPDDALANPLAGRIDPLSWFQNPALPLEIEIGSGKGSFILEQSKASPDTNYLGIEWANEFYLYAADRIRRAGRTNVRMLRTDATEFFRWRLPPAVARVVHLYFSDPWPKTRHHKNRVIQHRFLAQAWRILAPKGELRIVTDHDDLWAWDLEHFKPWTAAGAADIWRPHLTAALAHDNVPLPTAAPFEMRPFTPPQWVGEGQTVATNYEKKMCIGKQPHAATLVRSS